MRGDMHRAARSMLLAALLAATVLSTSCSGVRFDLGETFGDRLGRVRQHPDYVGFEISGDITEAELFQALETVAERTTDTDRVAVTAVLPEDGWRLESLVWNRASGRLERWTGEGGEWEFVDGLAGASTLSPAGVTTGVGIESIDAYGSGEAVPNWSESAPGE